MDNFLSGGSQSFGIQTSESITNDMADLIFGGQPVNSDSKTTPIKREPIKKKAIAQPIKDEDEELEPEQPEQKPTFTADDLLDNIDNVETEEDEETDKQKPSPKKFEPQPENEHSEFEEITKELVKLGIFKERDEDTLKPVKTGEAFRDRFKQEVTEKANNDIYNFIMSKHGEEGMEVFDALFVKGVPIKDYLNKYVDIQNFETMDLSTEDNQKAVFREAYRRQGLAEDKIERKLQRAVDYGDLEEESKDLHEIILKQDKEENNNRLAEAQEAEAQKRAEKNQYMNNMNLILGQKLKDKDFDGIPVTDKVARETFDYLTTPKWRTPEGEEITDFENDLRNLQDPSNHELRVKLALLLKNKLDLTKIKARLVSQDSNEVFGRLVRKDNQIKRIKNTIQPGANFFDTL